MKILDRILAQKRIEIDLLSKTDKLEQLRQAYQSQPEEWRQRRHFARVVAQEQGSPHLIAELKEASPSKGLIRPDFSPVELANAYYEGGAAALSVLTDIKFFQGDPEYLAQVRTCVPLPLLRKDFIISEQQVEESLYLGADCILLIVSALELKELARLRSYAAVLGLDVLVEVHDETELEMALQIKPDLIGINNRNLQTFHTDLAVCERLSSQVPADIPLVGESGIYTNDDVQRLAACGARAVLVGESLMRQHDVASAARQLMGRLGRET